MQEKSLIQLVLALEFPRLQKWNIQSETFPRIRNLRKSSQLCLFPIDMRFRLKNQLLRRGEL